jgi:hypothetical protein
VIGAPTLFLHDSYGDAAGPLLQPYFSRLSTPSFLGVDQRSILTLLRQSRIVIVETVERDFLKRAAEHIDESVLTPRFLDTLCAELARRP